ncbi:MAG: MoaD/ThiS family protein [Bacillota bacterium]|nr:MoaD/ThiS family protein [Bacillota bacterium]
MITIEAALFATLRTYNPNGESSEPFRVQLPEGSTIENLLKKLNIPPGESKQAFVNNRRQEWDYILQEGERVAIFPPIAGG